MYCFLLFEGVGFVYVLKCFWNFLVYVLEYGLNLFYGLNFLFIVGIKKLKYLIFLIIDFIKVDYLM